MCHQEKMLDCKAVIYSTQSTVIVNGRDKNGIRNRKRTTVGI